MKRISAFLVLTLLALGMSAASATAAPGLKLDKHDIGSKQCTQAGSAAKQLVDVHYTLVNDYDSGFNGNAWANDTINRSLRIWQHSDGTFCVQVADSGRFVTFAGDSPSGTSTVTAGVKGNIDGGYITSDIVGTYSPTLPTRGNLGTFDLACTSASDCPGAATAPSWRSYFSSVTSANQFAQWGWIYKAEPRQHGTWLNQDDVAAADSGDITG